MLVSQRQLAGLPSSSSSFSSSSATSSSTAERCSLLLASSSGRFGSEPLSGVNLLFQLVGICSVLDGGKAPGCCCGSGSEMLAQIRSKGSVVLFSLNYLNWFWSNEANCLQLRSGPGSVLLQWCGTMSIRSTLLLRPLSAMDQSQASSTTGAAHEQNYQNQSTQWSSCRTSDRILSGSVGSSSGGPAGWSFIWNFRPTGPDRYLLNPAGPERQSMF
ncbi:hypothetical protein CCH79_00005501 [Gambusia affinis]|uniref:Uncharacterized protein n=1 Tax=Gambusia affinis TaxID=33528 RepID=A0A315V6H5_GAMAF|nr:hypothetical protein CCH79_00005501 [Gambusia affinis]